MQYHDITKNDKPTTIRLPNTSPQNRRQFTHVRMLTRVDPDSQCGVGFNGKLYGAGARVTTADLGAHPVALEFAGPQGPWKCRARDNLWILWLYSWDTREWREIARASAFGSEWAAILRGPAIKALQPQVQPDPTERGREVASEILRAIDSALSPEAPAVRKAILSAIYDRMAGRLAAAA